MSTQADTTEMAGGRTAELPEKSPSEFSGQLQTRIQKIVDAVNESQKESLRHEVEITRINESELVSISVKPLTDWTEEGQLGTQRWHIILGPRGAVHHSVKSEMFVDDVELHKKTNAFGRTVSRLERLT
jgi:hypothetical protein